jgi:hypothetical protein
VAEMVRTAVQLVLDPPPDGTVFEPPPVVDPSLVVRASTGPAPEA